MDHGLLAPAWAATGVAELVDDRALLTAMLDTEVALAGAQAALGMIGPGDLASIREAAVVNRIDLAVLAAGVRATGNPVVALVDQLTAAVDPDAAGSVHLGCTSQDVLDTALMLLCAKVFDRIAADLAECARLLAEHVARHQDTPMAARTLTLHAVPTTFGLKAAGWLHLVLDAAVRVRAARAALPVSIGGAAGTLSAYREYAPATGPADRVLRLPALVARELGLPEPAVPWHAIRTPIADVASALLVTTGALGKIAADALVLGRTEIGEVAEAPRPGRGVSSAMPQKRNPVFSTLVATAARQLPPTAAVLFASMAVEDERSAGGWHAEWQPLRECLRVAGGAAANAVELVRSLRVSPERLAANLALTGGALVCERVNAVPAPLLGKAAAKRVLAEAERDGRPLPEVPARRVPGAGLGAADYAKLLDPADYTGVAATPARRVLDRHDAEGAR
ncbi:lyase family protein [Actinosynnema sp. NPDC051121]